MGAIPPKFPSPKDTFYQPEQADFVDLVANELGAAGTDGDGFAAIFDQAANEFPGGQTVISELDGLSAELADSTAAAAAPIDESFVGDLSRASLDGENLIGNLGDLGVDIQTATLTDFPALSDISVGALVPGFLQVDTGVAERSILDTTVGVRADGLVAWYIDGREHDPFQVNISVDGGDWALMSTDRGGNQFLGFDTAGHFVAIEWRNDRGILAQAYIDARDGGDATQVVIPPTPPDTTETGGVGGTPGIAPNSIPPVPDGLVPSGVLVVTVDGRVTWNTTNVQTASVTYQVGFGPEILFHTANSGDYQHFIMQPGQLYTWRLRDVSHGAPGTVLDEKLVTPAPAPAPTAAPAPAPVIPGMASTPGGIVNTTPQAAAAGFNLPTGVTWQARQSNSPSGTVTIYVPIDADGNNVSGVYGTITPLAQ